MSRKRRVRVGPSGEHWTPIRQRTEGWDDGFAGLPPRSPLREYRQAYQRGKAARRTNGRNTDA